MSQPPRCWTPDTIHHVISRGNRRQHIFSRPDDYDCYKKLMFALAPEYGVEFHAWCLMPNHLHLLLQAEKPLSDFMHSLQGAYSRFYNDKYGHSGHLYDGPFLSKLIDSERYFATAVRYIEENPYRARLLPSGQLWPHCSVQRIPALNEAEFAGMALDDFPYRDEPARVDLASLCEIVAARLGIQAADMRSASRGKAVGSARREFVAQAIKLGATRARLAAFLGVSRSAITQMSPSRTA